jgi:predicted secreted protein
MRRPLLSLVALAILALGPVACGSSSSDDSSPPTDNASGEDEEIKLGKTITDADDGKTIKVPAGQSFSVRLASNATTGYSWHVQSVDKTLGAPKEKYEAPPAGGPVGAGGTQVFTWSTKSPLDMSGTHKITLAYSRPWEETVKPAKVFTVTIDIGDHGCGTGPACGSGKWCSACWGHMACIPKGAMC